MKRTVGVYNADISKDQSSAITVNKALNIAGAEPDLLKTQEALYTINGSLTAQPLLSEY